MNGLVIGLLSILALIPILVSPLVSSRRPGLTTIEAAVLLAVLAITAFVAAESGPAAGFGAVAGQVLAGIAAVTGGGPVVRTTLMLAGVDPWRSDGPRRPKREIAGDADAPPPLRGGRVIGFLERAAIIATLLAGWPEGLVVILGIKGLARYPEIRDADAGEQFIIGTFASVLYAAGFAGVSYLLLH